MAVLHRPPMLILDEPTSGVDPVARDAFWRTLIDLSRNDGVTIFLSTHFMNEAERCDRISLMHRARCSPSARRRISSRSAAALLSRTPSSPIWRKRPEPRKKEKARSQPQPAAHRRTKPAASPEAAARNRALPGDLIPGGYGPMPGAKRWSCCAIPSGWHSRSSVLSF